MLKNIIALFLCLLIMAVFSWAGTSDFEDQRRVRGFFIAGVYK